MAASPLSSYLVWFDMGAKERREREKEQRRNQILDAARRLLFEKGLNATTVNQIARISELSVGLIYFYFKSKEELYATLQEEGLDILFDMIRDAASGRKNPREKLRRIAGAYYDFSEEHRHYFDILNYFLTSPEMIFPKNLKSQIDEHGNKILSILDSVIETGMEKKIFARGNVRETSVMLWSMLHGFLQFGKLRETVLKNEDYKNLYNTIVDRFIEGIPTV